MKKGAQIPWYAGEHKDTLFYLMIAIFLLEMVVGGVAFFYGIIHAAPEYDGGPPVARFPWLAWALSAALAPVALLLIVHLTGLWVSSALNADNETEENVSSRSDEHLPEGMKRFYASIRHAPVIVLFTALLLIGASLFFMDGALTFLGVFAASLVPYLPWIITSVALLLAFCFIVHAIMVFRQRKMENEYMWRREVLEKTGLVIVDKASSAIPQTLEQAALIQAEAKALPEKTLDVTPDNNKLPKGEEE